ncbi:MAG: biopolymer transporter ExbD [Pirellulales bacterium]|nr:biopolymer transporter ExbD [Pirellulales bacterium]
MNPWLEPSLAESGVATTVKRHRKETDSEMDITPMIDVTFLMLIFFLVASTPDVQAVIELPPANHGIGVSQRDSTILTIGDSGQENAPVYLADGKYPNALVTGSLEAQRQKIVDHVQDNLRSKFRKTDVLIKADRSVKHRDVARVIKAVSRVEGVKIHLAVLETE